MQVGLHQGREDDFAEPSVAMRAHELNTYLAVVFKDSQRLTCWFKAEGLGL